MCYLTFIDLFYCYLETKELENPTGENNWDQEYNCMGESSDIERKIVTNFQIVKEILTSHFCFSFTFE